jgi:hypothetical protein
MSYLYSADVIGDGIFEQGEIVKFEKCNKYKWCSIENTPFYAKGHLFAPIENGLYRKKSQKKTFLYVKNSDFLKNKSKKSFFKTPEDKLTKSEIQKIKINKIYGYTRVSIPDFKKKAQKKVLVSSVTKKQEKIVVKKEDVKKEDVKKEEVKKEDVKKEEVKKESVKKEDVKKEVVKKEIVMEEFLMEEVVMQEIVKQQETQKKDLFVYLSQGLSTIATDFDSLSRDISLEDDGINIDLGLGYRSSEIVFSTLSYQRAIFDEVNIDNLYVSLNYQFRETPLNPYVGAIIGFSRLIWSKYPVSGTLVNDDESTTLLGGLQLGIEYSFSDWSIFGEYQILKNEHYTNVLGYNLRISDQNNLNIGVRYEF